MINPITPKDITAEKSKHIPDFVINSFNKLIALNYCDGYSKVYQKDLIDEIIKQSKVNVENDDAIKQLKRAVYDNGWLNVEKVYENAGWKVDYDKPAYNEDYDTSFIFKEVK